MAGAGAEPGHHGTRHHGRVKRGGGRRSTADSLRSSLQHACGQAGPRLVGQCTLAGRTLLGSDSDSAQARQARLVQRRPVRNRIDRLTDICVVHPPYLHFWHSLRLMPLQIVFELHHTL